MNELYQKLDESKESYSPIVPILIDCNCGRFFNSNSPPNSTKLYFPISIDFNSSQFNMWNEFNLFSFGQKPFLYRVNELIPIFNVFNLFNPSILNVLTKPKLLSPISIDSTLINREKSNVV